MAGKRSWFRSRPELSNASMAVRESPLVRGSSSLMGPLLTAATTRSGRSRVPVCLIGAFDGALSIGSKLRVTVLDSTGQPEFHPVSDDHVVVRLPLSISSGSWMPEFLALAQAKDLPAKPEGTFLAVKVPVAASREETAQLLDEALRLIDEAQARASKRRSAAAATERYIQDWWERRKSSPQGNAAPD